MAVNSDYTPDNRGRYNVTIPGKPATIQVSGVDATRFRVVPQSGPPDLSQVNWRGRAVNPQQIEWLAHFKMVPRAGNPVDTSVTITVSDTTKTYVVVHDGIAEYIQPGTATLTITTRDPSVGWP